MKLMDIQKGVGQYLAGSGETDTSLEAPFSRIWEIDPSADRSCVPGTPSADGRTEAYGPESFAEWDPQRGRRPGPMPADDVLAAKERMEEAVQRAQPIAALLAAKQLNSFLNNQSLVILFTFKGKNLLFVGDAQAGNWEHWLFGTDSPEKKPGEVLPKTASDILASLDFYKVGHHGSGNATPKVALDEMGRRGRRLVSMCSTEEGVYGNEVPDDPSRGTEVPRIPLIEELAKDTAFVRSDQIDVTVDGRLIPARVAGLKVPDAPPGCRFATGELWIDCYL